MKIEDVKVKVVVDDAQARAVIDELMRGAAAFEQLLVGIAQALSSDAGQAVVIDALVGRIEELKKQVAAERWRADEVRNAALERTEADDVMVVLNAWMPTGSWAHVGTGSWRLDELSVVVERSHLGGWAAAITERSDCSPMGRGATPAQALLSAIARSAFSRGEAAARKRGGV